jgi:uncharacterized membrane protein YciS (DUF1049 family)
MSGLFRWALTVFILAALISFTLLNPDTVTISWFPVFAQLKLPISLLVLIVFAVGFIVGGFMVWLDGAPRRKEVRELRRYKKQQEKLAAEAAKPLEPLEVSDVPAPDLLRY